MEISNFRLGNGIRVVYARVPETKVFHCGYLINAGSRDEIKGEYGLAHYIEHGLFKGTGKRKAFHILNRLDMVGGEINAYTTKESTCIYAAVLNEYFERAIELLTDITFNSVFPEKEMEKEKEVILDEINSYLDNPSEQIYDDFEDQVFKGHPIGRNILGTTDSVRRLSRENILNFISRQYKTEEIVFSCMGNLSLKEVQKKIEHHLSGIQNQKGRPSVRKTFSDYSPENIVARRKNTFQAHYITGNIAYSRIDPKRFTLILLNNLLGGPGMNSRLNLAIREKFGFTYNLESNYSAFSDTGLVSIYLGTDPRYLEKSKNLVNKELKKLRDVKLGKLQLHFAIKQLTGQIAMAQENKSGIMLSLGKNILNSGKTETVEEIINRINKITSDDLLNVANEVFEEKEMSSLTFLTK